MCCFMQLIPVQTEKKRFYLLILSFRIDVIHLINCFFSKEKGREIHHVLSLLTERIIFVRCDQIQCFFQVMGSSDEPP